MDRESRFRALFERAYPALFRYAYRRGASQADAEDLVAASLEVAWRRIDDVPIDDAMPWLYAVARNMLRNQRRGQRRRDAYTAPLGLDLVDNRISQPGDLESLALRNALGRLREGDQELLRLIAWEGLSPAEAAVVIGCSPSAARTRLHRARARLAEQIEKDDVQRQGSAGHVSGRRTIALEATDE
ncbi:MAG TPA: sigma-70 family RNA polymerase sigma factor [Candidatus Dormibacteraeota bacterium]|nr:sigma-70 family RNA polymerase sigma factor [Candidatus Dormibacteraeota bacterium]